MQTDAENGSPPPSEVPAEPVPAEPAPAPDSITRGFLFSDLRAYTSFVETHGAAAASSLLDRYRALVREAIQRFGGAEIKTEGDSFYVVFTSVSNAVRCGLVITGNAIADATVHPDAPIQVGIGVHAGETIETAEGYVGSPVNIAARICSQAGPNEVLVSETVRALTRTLLPVCFEARGRRALKGIAEPIPLYAVIESSPGAVPWAEPQRRPASAARRALFLGIPLAGLVGAAIVIGIVLRSAAPSPPGSSAAPGVAGLPTGTWKIGLDMPLSGDASFRGIPVRNAVKLAIDYANNHGGINGAKLDLAVFDDGAGPPLGQDPKKGAANAQTMVGDPMTLAMVGPWGSRVANSVIPVTSAAGLLECSPANTDPFLTKLPEAKQLRLAHPDRISYVRLAPRDDIQAPALASFAFNDLKAHFALVVDDGADGTEIADEFQHAYEADGGQVLRASLKAGTKPASVLGPLSQGSSGPALVFFGGFTDTGGTALRKGMVSSGHAAIPLLSWDGLYDGPGATDGTYIHSVGTAAAVGSYVSHASLPLSTASFVDSFRRAYDVEPDEYAAAAYACVEVIVDSLRAVATTKSTSQGLREALRAYAVSHQFDETAIGNVKFDANGDLVHQFVTFYRVDPSAAGGKGDWVIAKQQDFGPAPN
ncbi:MAG: ABC transporter substrate-binding protein [Chloroflexota bacterium]|nr:ABC transporter substrate-binding protein [Chloroflexota bacterium]